MAIIIGITVIMFTYSWKITLVSLAAIAPTAIVTRYYSKMTFKYAREY